MSKNTEEIPAAEESKVLSLLEAISRESARQTDQLRRQLRATRWAAFFCVCLAAVSVFACLTLLPRVTGILAQADAILAELNTTAETINETVPSTMEDINALISQSRTGLSTAFVSIETALQKINAIDIASLNQAIADLAGIVRPLSSLLGGR